MAINNQLSFYISPLYFDELEGEKVVIERLVKEKKHLSELPQETVFGEIRAWRAWNVLYRDYPLGTRIGRCYDSPSLSGGSWLNNHISSASARGRFG